MALAEFTTKLKSGSRCLSSGVGTQMMMASAWAVRPVPMMASRSIDFDNAIGAAKAYRDGIAHALRIDDRTILLAALPLLLTDPTAPRLQIHLHSHPQP